MSQQREREERGSERCLQSDGAVIHFIRTFYGMFGAFFWFWFLFLLLLVG